MEYELIKSRRKSIAVEIKPDGRIVVRAPLRATNLQIEDFLLKHHDWIQKHYDKVMSQIEEDVNDKLSQDEIKELIKKAKIIIPQRVEYYAPIVGVSYGRISIRKQKSRWGSCSLAGNLNFNCLLMLTPPKVIDSIVVHELCHRLQMNHSDKFYKEVLRVFPDYKKWNKWLKENGNSILRRAEQDMERQRPF